MPFIFTLVSMPILTNSKDEILKSVDEIKKLKDGQDINKLKESIDSLNSMTEKTSLRKKPLTAISLRAPKALSSSSPSSVSLDTSNQWPDDASFKLDRWERERSQKNQFNDSKDLINSTSTENDIQLRPLPRSSRRRN